MMKLESYNLEEYSGMLVVNSNSFNKTHSHLCLVNVVQVQEFYKVYLSSPRIGSRKNKFPVLLALALLVFWLC